MPLFSILIPSYNRPEYLPKAVASVLASDFSDYELIVSDDDSPRKEEIRQALAPLLVDSRLEFIPQAKNLGEARNRATLMQRARGRFLIILADDDLLAPQALSVLQAAIEERPSFDFYLFGYSVIDGEDRLFETRRALRHLEISLENRPLVYDLFYSDLHPFWFYHPATFCFPASLCRDIVPNDRVGIGDDLMFLFDAILAGKRALIIPDALFSYRKFNMADGYSQVNQSSAPLANTLTRRHILYNLLKRDSLPASMYMFINSRSFRERFFYNSVVTDPDITEDALLFLDLTSEHLAELRRYSQFRRQPWFRYLLLLRRVARYAYYFGLPGLRESLRIYRERRAYWVLLTSERNEP